jgi:chromatin remodeling complex protein RSC6
MEANRMTNTGKKAKPGKGAPEKDKTSKAPEKAKSAPSAFAKPLQPSKELAAVVGPDPLPRTEVVSKMWEYIKKHKLQNEANKREILADEKLAAVFGKNKVTMFEMNKFLAQHLK